MVHHLLVGFKGASLKDFNERDSLSAKKLSFALYDSLKNNLDSFEGFVEKYSDDPGKKNGFGLLGWLPWGSTPMSFQSSVWGLEKGVLSKPILSPLGYHLAWVDSSRSSTYSVFDSSSYIFGSLSGKKSILIKISPSKTYEGLISGILITLLITFFLNNILSLYNLFEFLIYTNIFILFAFLGDVFESYFKRKANIKDSSKLIHGHGGFLIDLIVLL